MPIWHIILYYIYIIYIYYILYCIILAWPNTIVHVCRFKQMYVPHNIVRDIFMQDEMFHFSGNFNIVTSRLKSLHLVWSSNIPAGWKGVEVICVKWTQNKNDCCYAGDKCHQSNFVTLYFTCSWEKANNKMCMIYIGCLPKVHLDHFRMIQIYLDQI